MNGYHWRLTVEGKKYNPRQPRWPKGTPQGGQWAPAGLGRHFAITSKENTLAKGDDTELYRWSNAGEIVNATLRADRRASFDVTDKPFWYFDPPSMNPKTGSGWVDNVYGRVVLDREKLEKAGWAKAPGFEAEGGWFWKPSNIGKRWNEVPDQFVIDSYLDAVRGYEVVKMPEGHTVGELGDVFKLRMGREVPVIQTTVSYVTEPFKSQEKYPWWGD